jgi:hypothetical protein
MLGREDLVPEDGALIHVHLLPTGAGEDRAATDLLVVLDHDATGGDSQLDEGPPGIVEDVVDRQNLHSGEV